MRITDRIREWLGLKPRAALDGGSTGRLFRNSPTITSHPDREIQYDLAAVRARARHLVRNDSTIAGFVEIAADNVIGHCGVQLQAQVANRAGALATATNAEIERGWSEFGRIGNCTVDGRLSMVQLQRVLYVAKKVDGEVFVRVHVGPDWAHGLALQVIPADLLDETYDKALDNGNEIRLGVEVNEFGRPVAYHFFKRHPIDRFQSNRERIRVPADEVIHYRRSGEVGQTRAFSELAPILYDALMLKGAMEAELVLWRQSASKGIRYEAVSEEAIQAYAAAIAKGTTDAAALPETVELSPGLEQYIAPGWKMAAYDPSVPNTNVESFGRFALRRIARGLNVAYPTLTGDLADATYSSMRMGLLPERDHWKWEQSDMVEQVLVPIYRRWIAAALLKGVVRLDTRLGSQYHEVEFAGRGWQSPDPAKDREADLAGIQMGVMTRSEVAASEGRNYEDVVDRLKYEQEYANTAGVNVDGEQKEKVPEQGQPTALRAIS